jgi:hypothetical protein
MPANEIKLHIPACVSEGWEFARENPMRRLFIEQNEQPLPIGTYFDTPTEWYGEPTPVSLFKNTALYAKALLEAIHQNPQLKRCLIHGVLAETIGETIAVTARDRDDEQTLIATLDYGESTLRLMGRFATMRQILKLPPEIAYGLLTRAINPDVPPPQVLLSNVSHLKEWPQMCLGGCAGYSPMALAIGSKKSHLVVDHRIFDVPDELALINGLCENVRRMVACETKEESQA